MASAVVIKDKMTGTPRGFGFVELAEGEDLQRAIGSLNGQALDGRPLTVNEARPQRAAFSGNRAGGDRDFGRRRKLLNRAMQVRAAFGEWERRRGGRKRVAGHHHWKCEKWCRSVRFGRDAMQGWAVRSPLQVRLGNDDGA